MSATTHTKAYFEIAAQICRDMDHAAIEKLVEELAALRAHDGRLFLIGVGGSAANCSHAVNDFRKLCNIEAYTPADNVAELTARTNDEGWDTVFAAWLATSRAGASDGLLVMSVGGGSIEHRVSVNIVRAVDEAKRRQLKIFGIVGRDGGHTRMVGDTVIRVPVPDHAPVTPHTEAFQALVWHAIVCHPSLMVLENKWEGLEAR